MKQHCFAFCLAFFPSAFFAQTRYCESVFDQVSVTLNVQYGANATVVALSALGQSIPQPLVLDFYEPAGDTLAARPLVLVLPGGNFLPYQVNGTCGPNHRDSVVVELCTRLAKMGYTAAAVSYRLGWNPVAPNQTEQFFTLINALYRGAQDARTAVRFFKKTVAEDANTFRVDTARIAMWGESTGAGVALCAAYANHYTDWLHPALITPSGPMVIESVNGDIAATSTGIVPPGYPLYPAGDTLCYPNWPGYGSGFHLCVSVAGIIPNVPWIGADEAPGILFQAPNDLSIPCGAGLWSLPPFYSIFETAGSCALAQQLQDFGNNQAFTDAAFTDAMTAQANLFNGGLEGFFPFIGLPPEAAQPWDWGAPCPANPDLNTDAAMARLYVDTMLAYFAPRAVVALDLTRSACPGAGSATETPEQPGALNLSPNPAGDFVWMPDWDALAEQAVGLNIFDVSGRSFFVWEKNSGAFLPEKIGTADWPCGLYFVQLRMKTGVSAGKFVKN